MKRESQSYLLPTLASLIESMNEEEKNDTLIIVFVAEVSCFLKINFYLDLCKRHSTANVIALDAF